MTDNSCVGSLSSKACLDSSLLCGGRSGKDSIGLMGIGLWSYQTTLSCNNGLPLHRTYLPKRQICGIDIAQCAIPPLVLDPVL